MSQLVLREVDEAENHTAVFIYSDQRHIPDPGPAPARVDISVSHVKSTRLDGKSCRVGSEAEWGCLLWTVIDGFPMILTTVELLL